MEYQTYSDFRPSQFDAAGLGLPAKQSWRVIPCSQTRDSEPLDRSNFKAALESLGGEGETVEIHRFGHWGPGWFEIIIVDPSDNTAMGTADDIEACLADYPVLDEEALSELEDAELHDWADQECRRIANSNDLDLQGDYCASWVVYHFDQWNYHEGQPEDDEIRDFLLENNYAAKGRS